MRCYVAINNVCFRIFSEFLWVFSEVLCSVSVTILDSESKNT